MEKMDKENYCNLRREASDGKDFSCGMAHMLCSLI